MNDRVVILKKQQNGWIVKIVDNADDYDKTVTSSFVFEQGSWPSESFIRVLDAIRDAIGPDNAEAPELAGTDI